MGRRETILDGLATKKLVGVELGPLDNPLVTKDQGTIFYVDHCDTEALKARWSTDKNVDTSRLHVDAVWGARTLRQALVAASNADEKNWSGVDYVVASHVIEHVPDLISWLAEINEILRPAGTVRLAVPDKRYSFDYLRRTSSVAEVLDAFVRKRRVPSASRVLDFALNMAIVDCGKAWHGEIVDEELKHPYSPEDAMGLARDAEENGTYHDVHCWVFTPASFIELMGELARLRLVRFACDWLVTTKTNTLEFYVSMRPTTDPAEAAASWKTALLKVQPERAAPATPHPRDA